MMVWKKEKGLFREEEADQNQNNDGETCVSAEEDSNHILQPHPKNLDSTALENLLPVSRRSG
jgi:hypothetical protein